MTISVIIATYNRAAMLADCLGHLARQGFEPGDEIIVVDNGSTDETPRIIAEMQSRSPIPIIRLEEPAAGKSRAIARALPVATGDILAFTDDDVEVDASWLDAIRRAIADPDIALVGGPVAPRWERTPPRWLRRATEQYKRLTAPLGLADYGTTCIELGPRTALGGNLAIRRDVFARVGGFAAHLGKVRGTLLSGEDHDLCRRVQAAGLRTVYDPGIRVRHWVQADRMRVRYQLSWFFWSGITHAELDAADPQPGRRLAGIPLYLIRRAPTATLRAAAALLRCDLARAIDSLTDAAFALGYASRSYRRTAAPAAITPVARQS